LNEETLMTNEELKGHVNRNMIATVVLYNVNRPRLDRDEIHSPQWEIWAYGWGTTPYEEMLGSIDGVLKNPNKTNENKLYNSIDEAYLDLRVMGYQGKIEIDG
jgi:hypothetical protein